MITYEKTDSGVRILVDGKFVGWQCNNCLHGKCEYKGKYGECTPGE